LSEKEQIEKLKELALKSPAESDYTIRLGAINAIGAYGDAGIPALVQISERGAGTGIQSLALDWIAKIKART
jgi:hypothetical protein